jgi:hypothetical protein
MKGIKNENNAGEEPRRERNYFGLISTVSSTSF